MSKDFARQFYNGTAWRKTQAAFMQSKHYICERCGDAARVVHHVKHITPSNINDQRITLDWANLQALCMDCHADVHAGSPVMAPGLRFNSRGEVVPCDPA